MGKEIYNSEPEMLNRYLGMYGGYWRYEGLMDYCYLINPFFPTKELVEEMKDNFDTLLRQYPSGMAVNSELAADMFGLNKNYVCVGNGAAELIKSLMENFTGKLGLIYPTFEEYPHRKSREQLDPFYVLDMDFEYGIQELMDYYEGRNIQALLIVNPDNPSGHYIGVKDLLELAGWCAKRGIVLVVDESFVDFAGGPDSECGWEEYTLLKKHILEDNRNLVVIKSISKSYGVPGARLGVLATADEELISAVKKDVAIWNINSYGEYFMQIIGKYKKEYQESLTRFHAVRANYVEQLENIPGLKVYPSQANYVMCKILSDISSRNVAEILLSRYNILIKDLSGKEGFEAGNYIRLSVKTEEENASIVRALRDIL